MTAALVDIVAELDRLDREREALMAQLRAATRAPVAAVLPNPAASKDWVRPGEAAKAFGIHRSVLHRIGTDHLNRIPANGCCRYGVKSRREYSISRLLSHFKENPHSPRRSRDRDALET